MIGHHGYIRKDNKIFYRLVHISSGHFIGAQKKMEKTSEKNFFLLSCWCTYVKMETNRLEI